MTLVNSSFLVGEGDPNTFNSGRQFYSKNFWVTGLVANFGASDGNPFRSFLSGFLKKTKILQFCFRKNQFFFAGFQTYGTKNFVLKKNPQFWKAHQS